MGAINVTSNYLKIAFTVTADPTATNWSLWVDTLPLVQDAPIPTPFDYAVDPATAGSHLLLVTQSDVDGVQTSSVTQAVNVVDPSTILQQIRPDVQMVADLVRTRIVTEGGAMVPDDLDFEPADSFTANTYPTDAQVERLIDQAAPYIVAQVPGSIAEDYLPSAKHLAALYAAILVEGSYFREQLTDDQVELYRTMLIAGIRGLGATGQASQPGVGAGGAKAGKVDSVMQRSVMTVPLVDQWDLMTRDWTGVSG
jgi:hypothetical protein